MGFFYCYILIGRSGSVCQFIVYLFVEMCEDEAKKLKLIFQIGFLSRLRNGKLRNGNPTMENNFE